MSDCGKEIALIREGSDQLSRYIEALDPSSVRLNDFGLKEWLQFAYKFAGHVNYFDTSDPETPSGNWEDFFIGNGNLNDFLLQVSEGKQVAPHLALFVAFIWLLQFSQKRFNGITKRHLDFYYKEILKIEKQPATPDKVHLIFELAKRAETAKIEKGTPFDGGKDKTGQKLIYESENEYIAGKAQVAGLFTLYNDQANNKLKAATLANSFDGEGAPFPDRHIKWWPFGYYEKASGETGNKPGFPELKDAKCGFAIASGMLNLCEGERHICLNIEFDTDISAISVITQNTLIENLKIFCTGNKGWLGPFSCKTEAGKIFRTEAQKKEIKLAFTIPLDEKPVVPYSERIHGENFTTDLPICRVLIKTEKEEGYKLCNALMRLKVSNINLKQDVSRIKKGLIMENDIGSINGNKPFYPFGTIPIQGSNFTIDYPELFSKNWNNLTIDIKWKNTPKSFPDLYHAYETKYQSNAKGPSRKIVTGDNYFTADVKLKNKGIWLLKAEKIELFKTNDNGFKTKISIISNKEKTEPAKCGPISLSLNQSFLHELYARIYAMVLIRGGENNSIPNEPYTPLIDEIHLSYEASEGFNQGVSIDEYIANRVKLFHEHPFGQSEEHPYIKGRMGFSDSDEPKIGLVPILPQGGQLYIGLENTEPLQQISLLLQMREGSENPLTPPLSAKQKIEWSVLGSNYWRTLASEEIIRNETNNFLKSGLMQFTIPGEATINNTRMPAGLIWVKAHLPGKYDAVSQAIAIYAQAITAKLDMERDNYLHLEKGITAGTITKMAQRNSAIKSVFQPFSSFGGAPEESDKKYYTRISERLRHKDRAISIWDYEQLVLQNFPQIHKVKCLNHTSDTSFLAPGNLYLIVVPDIVNKNVFDIYKPRVSQAKLIEIKKFVDARNSLHVNTIVANPDYEEVSVSVKVKFRAGYDKNYYQKVLNEDIVSFLSPWAFHKTATLRFENSLHLSSLVHYLEKLDYVDYLQEVKMKKDGKPSGMNIMPGSPKAILVSAKQHDIKLTEISCPIVMQENG